MSLLSCLQVLLACYSGQSNICVGTPIANRRHVQTEGLIGFFVNTVVLRTNLGGNPTFVHLLQQVREICLQAYAHQDVPFEKVVEALKPARTLSHSPLFQVMLVLQNTPLSTELTRRDTTIIRRDRALSLSLHFPPSPPSLLRAPPASLI